MGEMRVLNREGDLKVIWDEEKQEEVEAAEEQFKKLKAKGYNAFEVKKDGSKGKMIDSFKKSAGAIIMVPALVGG